MAGTARSGSGTFGRLMLLAALLFGIVTMHTVGHPAEHSDVSAAVTTTTAEHMVPAAPVAGSAHPAAHGAPGSDAPMSGMDPLSVCLAVLGVWGLALVGAWLLGPRADRRPLGTPEGAGLPLALRPNPPPPISVLASVSVLRI
ncbi:DUF6153 family protein [Streptomyces griseus]|uniref:DUF6153 family protein n=1 Tax=Streptomyces TaxID=1883 RepID=UPI0029C2A563|nr:DUF6153 family protein [Streptomyces sp. ID01-9D]MDX5574330.1 DUF6153 family protein [Streptomyces sp. ID01-9D]WTC90298.1 DUF6153 family protein [Streptomyces griseus]WTD67072.1 DUF6153 family protein [Streptomyces griseus]